MLIPADDIAVSKLKRVSVGVSGRPRPTFFKSHCSTPIFEFWIWHGVIDGSRGVVLAALYSTASHYSTARLMGRAAKLDATCHAGSRPVPPATQRCRANGALQTIVRPRTAREVTDLTRQRSRKSVAPTAKYCQEAGSPNYRRVNQYSTSQNIFAPISSISTLNTFSSSAGPPKESPGIVLAKKKLK